MFGMRRWLHSTAAKAFVVALLGILVTPTVQACPMPMTDVSMAYGNAEMPEACAGLPKEACLVAYVQDDRAAGSGGASTASAPVAALSVAAQRFATFAPHGDAALHTRAHSGAPPPRLLFCRMLE